MICIFGTILILHLAATYMRMYCTTSRHKYVMHGQYEEKIEVKENEVKESVEGGTQI